MGAVTSTWTLFYMLKGDIGLEYMQEGKRHEQVIRDGERLLVPAMTPHAPHRPPDTWGLVVGVTYTVEHTKSLRWCCDRCHAPLHEVTRHVADLERELKAAIEHCDTSVELCLCRQYGEMQPE
jgi:3-hydroxyanthranilate 3,4-dioxygenase